MSARAKTMTAEVTGKRKREDAQARPSAFKKAATKPAVKGKQKAVVVDPKQAREPKAAQVALPKQDNAQTHVPEQPLSIQIVTGSYERVLHGFSASIPAQILQDGSEQQDETTSFSDTFLFAAHTSAVRCLAISPPTEADKRFLATGSSDERINIYSVSSVPPSNSRKGSVPSLGKSKVAENSSNRSLGSLIHHDRAISRLAFPAKGKLFSAAEDNTVAISRTRDWTVLSTIKAPIPKVQGRPSGDTAGPGEVPTGVNDFAIHPSQKLMLTVGKGEKSMRLWNLMTGKKAGVLNFDRELLGQVSEGKFSSGEGRRVLWDEAGENYVVGFERGAVLFGIDSNPKAVIKPSPPTKLHQMHFLPGLSEASVLAVSTEDGRILFYDAADLEMTETANGEQALPACKLIAQLGGKTAGVTGRVKDFEVVRTAKSSRSLVILTASSDGIVRLWHLDEHVLASPEKEQQDGTALEAKQVGTLIGTHETGNRITCLGAFSTLR